MGDMTWSARAKMIGINFDAITEQDIEEMRVCRHMIAVRDESGKVVDFEPMFENL